MPCTIEPTPEKHLPGLRSTLNTVLGERRYFLNVQRFSLAEVRDFRTSLVDRSGVQFVTLDGSAVVGWCDIRRRPNKGSRHVGVIGIGIQSGGFGLGPALLDRAVDAAADLGVSRVELEMLASNTHAIHVYRNAGVEREGIKRRARIFDGQTDDASPARGPACAERFRHPTGADP